MRNNYGMVEAAHTEQMMIQGHSGSFVHREGDVVVKEAPWPSGMVGAGRIRALIAASRELDCLPEIYQATPEKLCMQYIPGVEGLTAESAVALGRALRSLHGFVAFDQPICNGMPWLFEKANQALNKVGRSALDPCLAGLFEEDAVVHGEPTQIILMADGSVRFIDFDGMGGGSKFHDLGFLRYSCDLYAGANLWSKILKAYDQPTLPEAPIRIASGLVALAYSNFHDFQCRLEYGLQQLGDLYFDSLPN